MSVPDAVWIAMIGSLATVLTTVFMPIFMAKQTAAEKAAEREAEWRRQDVLAERLREDAKEAAQRISETARNTARDLSMKADITRADMGSKLDVIHTLVNGKATEAMRNELIALIREVNLRRELNRLKQAHGETLNPVELATVDLAELRIKELRATLGEKIDLDITALEQQKTHATEAAATADRETEKAQDATDAAIDEKNVALDEKNAALEENENKETKSS